MRSEDRASLSISSGHIRLSVVVEDADDLIEDMDQALACLFSSYQTNLCARKWRKKYTVHKIGGCILRCDSVN